MSDLQDDDRDRLIADLFHEGDWRSGIPAGLARNAAAAARRRRARRTIGRFAAGLAGMVAIGALLPRHSDRPAPAVSARSTPEPAYEVISDDELLVLVKDLPLLVQSDGKGGKVIKVLTEPDTAAVR